MSNQITIPCGKHNAKFELLNLAGGKMVNASYWTYSAKAGFHTPYASFQIPIEAMPVLIDWLSKHLPNAL
jgi:hypothetical protein